jgi:hypothetical protein
MRAIKKQVEREQTSTKSSPSKCAVTHFRLLQFGHARTKERGASVNALTFFSN